MQSNFIFCINKSKNSLFVFRRCKGKAIMLNDLYKNPYVPIIVQPLAVIVQLFVQVLGFSPYSKH
jgi:hypothetical protein